MNRDQRTWAICLAVFALALYGGWAQENVEDQALAAIQAYSNDHRKVVGVFRAANLQEKIELLQNLDPQEINDYYQALQEEGVVVMVTEKLIQGGAPKYILVKLFGAIFGSHGNDAFFTPINDSRWLLVLAPPKELIPMDRPPRAEGAYTIADPFKTVYLIDWPDAGSKVYSQSLYKSVDLEQLEKRLDELRKVDEPLTQKGPLGPAGL